MGFSRGFPKKMLYQSIDPNSAQVEHRDGDAALVFHESAWCPGATFLSDLYSAGSAWDFAMLIWDMNWKKYVRLLLFILPYSYQKGQCQGYELEWNIGLVQSLVKRTRPFVTKEKMIFHFEAI
jgi:hypothetical protein